MEVAHAWQSGLWGSDDCMSEPVQIPKCSRRGRKQAGVHAQLADLKQGLETIARQQSEVLSGMQRLLQREEQREVHDKVEDLDLRLDKLCAIVFSIPDLHHFDEATKEVIELVREQKASTQSCCDESVFTVDAQPDAEASPIESFDIVATDESLQLAISCKDFPKSCQVFNISDAQVFDINHLVDPLPCLPIPSRGEQLKEQFRALNDHGDGTVDADTLLGLLRGCSTFTDSQGRALLTAVGVGADGRIQVDHFVDFLHGLQEEESQSGGVPSSQV